VAIGDRVVILVGYKPDVLYPGGQVYVQEQLSLSGWSSFDYLAGTAYGAASGRDTGDTRIATVNCNIGADNSLTSALVVFQNGVDMANVAWGMAIAFKSSTGALFTVTKVFEDDPDNGGTIHFDSSALGQVVDDVCIVAKCIPTDVAAGNGYSSETLYRQGVVKNYTDCTHLVEYEPSSALGDDIGGLVSVLRVNISFTGTSMFEYTGIAELNTNGKGPAVLIRVHEVQANVTGPITGSFENWTASIDAHIVGGTVSAEFESFTADIGGTFVPLPTEIVCSLELFNGVIYSGGDVVSTTEPFSCTGTGYHTIAPGDIVGNFSQFDGVIDGTYIDPTNIGILTAATAPFTGEISAGATVVSDLVAFSGEIFAGASVDVSFLPFTGNTYSNLEYFVKNTQINRFVNRLLGNRWFTTDGWDNDPVFGVYGWLKEWVGEGVGLPETFVVSIVADFATFDANISSGSAIQDEFQLWNGALIGDMADITGSFSDFTGEITGVYAFNSVCGDITDYGFNGEMFSGGSIVSTMSGFSDAIIDGSIGYSLGMNAFLSRFTAEMFSGAIANNCSAQNFTADIIGTVKHVNRINSVMSLWDATLDAVTLGAGDIIGSFNFINSNITGYIINPATIVGSILPFGFTGRASQESMTGLIGYIMEFTGKPAMIAANTTPANVYADMEEFDMATVSPIVCSTYVNSADIIGRMEASF
jgi:hypothetical protein